MQRIYMKEQSSQHILAYIKLIPSLDHNCMILTCKNARNVVGQGLLTICVRFEIFPNIDNYLLPDSLD
jgi:hypothetical protein